MKVEATIDALKKEELQTFLAYGQKRLAQLIAEEQQRAREEVEAMRAKTEKEAKEKLEKVGLPYTGPAKVKTKAKKVKVAVYRAGHVYVHPEDPGLKWNGTGVRPGWVKELETAGRKPVEMQPPKVAA